MSDPHREQAAGEQLGRLQDWRNRRPRAADLKFVQRVFQRDIERPFKQLGDLATIWRQTVPPRLVERTALARLTRGTLHVTVTDSATAYELDRALRAGLQRKIRGQFKGNLRQIRLKVEPLDTARERGGASAHRKRRPEE